MRRSSSSSSSIAILIATIIILQLIFPVIAVSSSTTSSSTTTTAQTRQQQHQQHLRPCSPNPSSSSSLSIISVASACRHRWGGFLAVTNARNNPRRRWHPHTSITSFQRYHCSQPRAKQDTNKHEIIIHGNNHHIIHNNNNHHGRSCKHGRILFFDNNGAKLQLQQEEDHDEGRRAPSFLSTNEAKVAFRGGLATTTTTENNAKTKNNGPSLLPSLLLLSPADAFLRTLTSDRTSLLLGSTGMLLLLLNRLLTFPDIAEYASYYEASLSSRSRIDLLGVLAAGSVLLNGLTKLDVESARAERVVLEGWNAGSVIWDDVVIEHRHHHHQQLPPKQNCKEDSTAAFRSVVEWALLSYLKCTPAKTAVLLARRATAATPPPRPRQEDGTANNNTTTAPWTTLARVGTLPFDSQIMPSRTPILDRMFRDDDDGGSIIKGGTVGGADVVVVVDDAGGKNKNKKGNHHRKKESYLPTLQALPGKVEFTYLPSNAQEALILPVVSVSSSFESEGFGGWYCYDYAVVLGGDVAKSFAPRDIAWCKEIASWIGEELLV